jgi:hypothetical protein
VKDLYLVGEALSVAASRVEPWPGKKDFQERSLEVALSLALRDLDPETEPVPRRKTPETLVPGWDPQPGAVDLVAKFAGQSLFFELKVDDIGDAVWDIAKLACLISDREENAAVVAVAARESAWERDRTRAGLFELPAGVETSEEWEMRFLVATYASEWKKALSYNPRPVRLPSGVVLRVLGRWSVPAFPGYELRAAAVTAWGPELMLSDGWPVPDPRTISDDDLEPHRIPGSDADIDDIRHFAITSNGYTNYGNSRRLSDAATRAYDQWKQTGNVDGSLRELRSFLFFHQRAEHFGFGLDEPYVRAVTDEIRARVESQQKPE